MDGVDLDQAVRVLEAWDHTVSRESTGGLLFTEFWQAYCRAVGATGRADAAKVFRVPWDETHPTETPYGIADATVARSALASTIKALQAKHGKLDIPWGDVHRLRRGQLDVPLSGYAAQGPLAEFGEFRVIWHDEAKDGKLEAAGGDSYVFAVEFTSPPTAYSIMAYSQSSDPQSPHHADQSALFAREEWKRAWFTEEDIVQNLKATYRP
jgi:acyl-homoserine-lactone acylase